jgi:hypothetical protein
MPQSRSGLAMMAIDTCAPVRPKMQDQSIDACNAAMPSGLEPQCRPHTRRAGDARSPVLSIRSPRSPRPLTMDCHLGCWFTRRTVLGPRPGASPTPSVARATAGSISSDEVQSDSILVLGSPRRYPMKAK